VLFNEPKLLKCWTHVVVSRVRDVSVLFNEPKLLKSRTPTITRTPTPSFSALQRAEIAEIYTTKQQRVV